MLITSHTKLYYCFRCAHQQKGNIVPIIYVLFTLNREVSCFGYGDYSSILIHPEMFLRFKKKCDSCRIVTFIFSQFISLFRLIKLL